MRTQLRAAALAAAVLMVFATAAAGQAPLRTPDGQPDLQGVWDFRTMTPLERPEGQEQAFLSEEEAAQLEAGASARRAELLEPSEVRTEPLPAGGGGLAVGGYNDFWLDYGTNVIDDRRTSLVVDPPDGRLPALTPEGEALRQEGSLWETCRSAGPCASAAPASAPTIPRTAGSPSGAWSGSTAGPR